MEDSFACVIRGKGCSKILKNNMAMINLCFFHFDYPFDLILCKTLSYL